MARVTRLDLTEVSAALGWAASVLGAVVEVRELLGGSTSTMLAVTPAAGERAVLRLVTREPWRTHGAALTTREHEVQAMLAATAVPAPRTVALDAGGDACGHPAHLMALLPGAMEERTDATSLGRLADLLARVHDVSPTIEVRPYQSWAWAAKHVVPEWGQRPTVWEAAFELLREEPPAHEPTFLHRDFQPRNVLWRDGAVSGLVDWVETSVGPAWLDVAHCATNLAIRHGDDIADDFQGAYTARTGRAPAPYFDVMDVVGFLPPPGRTPFSTDPAELGRLEGRLAAVLARV